MIMIALPDALCPTRWDANSRALCSVGSNAKRFVGASQFTPVEKIEIFLAITPALSSELQVWASAVLASLRSSSHVGSFLMLRRSVST